MTAPAPPPAAELRWAEFAYNNDLDARRIREAWNRRNGRDLIRTLASSTAEEFTMYLEEAHRNWLDFRQREMEKWRDRNGGAD